MGARLRKLGKSGNYFFVAYDASRRPKEKSCPLQTTRKDVAMKKFGELLDRYERGAWSPWEPEEGKPQEYLTVRQAIERFMQDRSHLRKKTLKHYRQQLEAIKWPPGLMMADVHADHLRPYIYAEGVYAERVYAGGSRGTAKRKRRTIAQATKRKRYASLRTFIRWAVEDGLIRKSPLDDIPMPKPHEKAPRFLTAGDVEKLLAAIDYKIEAADRRTDVQWLRDIIVLAINTGPRSGELRHLRWSDVDLANGFLNVRNRDGFETKTGDERPIPLVGEALAVLQRRHAEREDSSKDDYVIVDRQGKPIDVYRLSHRFKDFVRLAKLDERFRFHDTRHTCGSWLAMKGVPLRVIQQILGHRSVTTTEIYAHLHPDVIRSAMEMTFGSR